MAYKLLGIVVWKSAKWFLRGRYGTLMAPKPLLAAGLVLVLVGAGLVARQRGALEA